ncbi:uncharacterized protein BJX67DRAFT_372785 [Aspergillus lucknowensis]|uniref:Protein NO VEIN C-terminal domain-containing protein n=1 Tax=Aspergillus lucknowensis TaxID=176173 RepID=A0ABR4LNL1_9EURO
MDLTSARALVKQIARDHGHLGEETLSQMPPDIRREVGHALLQKDGMIGSSVITLAKNLYSSTARFVFGLLQNADDNCYTTARSILADPFVSFHVYDRRVVVECNEDGFTRENLVAICNVGKSSKTGAQGYIREKGIGFKSVFMVAWKVHIQSREFSFSFRHRKGDPGMGMISPIWEETEEVLPQSLTRITLFLHDDGPGEATFLLFMKNLRRIEVKMHDSSDQEVSHTTFSIHNQPGGRVAVKQEIVRNGAREENTQHYHTTRFTATDIPPSENREYTEGEMRSRAYAQTDIILAFPLTPESAPALEPQEIYAFLPIRNMGLPFLIQADFVTDASRQDIVKSSARNMKLLPAIAQAFVQAAEQLCTDPDLAYVWMRYLPDIKWGSEDKFWKDLPGLIYRQLQVTSTMWTRSPRRRCRISNVRVLPPTICDAQLQPLLPDLDPPQYLSSLYDGKDVSFLKSYGLQSMNSSDFLDRLQQDVKKSSSTMRNPDTDDKWHSSVAKYLISVLRPKPQEILTKIKDIELIPLMGGAWTTPWSCSGLFSWFPVYFPKTQGYALPTDGIFKLVAPNADENPHRKELFALLGVQEASIQDVRRRIIANTGRPLTYGQRRYELHFLYLTAHLDPTNDSMCTYVNLTLPDSSWNPKSWREGTWYFADGGPYEPQGLLAQFSPRPSILHPFYMQDFPEQPEEEIRSWRAWLSQTFQIREVIPLTAAGKLSAECLYIARSCPDKFLAFLLKYWTSEGAKIVGNLELIQALLKIEVPCQNGRAYPLGKTYVRTTQLEHADTFFRDGERFPWLKLDSLAQTTGLCDIGVLTAALDFGHPKSDLEFYLAILQAVADENREKKELLDDSRIFDLYTRIATRYTESVTRDVSREMIVAQRLIYVPGYGSESTSWVFPRECLIAQGGMTRDLFRDILRIGDIGIDDLLLELEWARNNYIDQQLAVDLYQELDKRRPKMNDATMKKIRERFERDCFIYYELDGKKSWHKPSECLWAPVTEIKGMIHLHNAYEDLADFFIELIGVPTLTLQMVYDKLVSEGNGQTPPEKIKETIWLLNSYIQDEHDFPDPRQVLQSRVFPVKYPSGVVELCSSSVDFAINDRMHLSDLFTGKAKFLDFNVNEIARLEPFLKWTGLHARYLSSSVKEISAVHGDSHRPLTSPSRKIAGKAHGLLRIAVHLKSPRLRSGEHALFESLKRIDVRETDGISSELHLNQDGKDIMVEINKSELHFNDSDEGLIIYVPRDEKMQCLCFLDRIPKALMEWIMTEPLTRICEPHSEKFLGVLSTVLQAEPKYVEVALDRAGIMTVETPDDVEVEETASDLPEQPIGRTLTHDDTFAEASSRSTRSDSSVTLADAAYAAHAFPSSTPRVSARSLLTPQQTPSPAPFASPSRELSGYGLNTTYLNLLRSVVTAARTSPFPRNESPHAGTLSDSTGADNGTFPLRGLDKPTRDKLIGAAGELFVFETLSRITPSLPGFSRDNWQSTIRKYVNIHEDYTDLEPWFGRETADITYVDSEGVLTTFLIATGYLDDSWVGAKPDYFLEVKSTTSECATPLYVSKARYDRMQTMRNIASQPADRTAVYMIFRPYYLGCNSMRMKIYVNPALMEERGELVFTVETWSVVPRLAGEVII